jgi:Uma2 family endonuclease
MNVTRSKLPDSIKEDNELLRVAASWNEYMAIVEQTPYTLQFFDGEVIGSQPDAIHETIIPNVGWLLGNYYNDKADYRVLGSNIKIAIIEEKIDFNADLSVVKEPVDYGLTPVGRPSNCQIKNPEIVVEVLSKSTRNFDQGEKLDCYKLMPSLQHILFVDQARPFASVYSRTAVPDEWLNHDYRTLESVVRLGDVLLPMQDIYRKVVFDA